jgi:formylglycine-generating enzyme required for sulfatase activity
MPPLSTDYIFMSYSRRDDAVMRRIVAFLRERGIKVWVDNEELIPGTPVWEKEIEIAVQGASAVVVVLSPDSKDSEWVRREISLADQYERRVFPVLVRGDEKTSVSLRLIGRQYVDIRSNEEAGLNYVSATLLRYLEELNEREQNAKKEADRLAAQKIKTEKRLAARKAEEERIALEKVATERKAKEDADRLAAQKAEEERIALEKIATERKAKEDLDRLAAQKANEERIANEKNVGQVSNLTDENEKRLAAQKIEEERIAQEKVQADRKAKAEADRLAAQQMEQEPLEKQKAERETTQKAEEERIALAKMSERDTNRLSMRNTTKERLAHEIAKVQQNFAKLLAWKKTQDVKTESPKGELEKSPKTGWTRRKKILVITSVSLLILIFISYLTIQSLMPSYKTVQFILAHKNPSSFNFGRYIPEIDQVTFSPDGKLLASICWNCVHSIQLWDVNNGNSVQTLKVSGFRTIAFSPDGGSLAFGKYEQIGIWSVSDKVLLKTLNGHTGWIYSVAFSPDGQRLVSSSEDKTVRLWRVSDGSLLRTLEGHTDTVVSAAFSPDGKLIASSSTDNTIRIWQAGDGALLNILQELHTVSGKMSKGIAFSPDGQILASGSVEGMVHLWRVSDGALLNTLRGHNGAVNSVAFSPNGYTLASSSDDGTARLWRWSENTIQELFTVEDKLQGEYRDVTSIAFSSDGKLLASSANNGTIRLWDATVSQTVTTEVAPTNPLTASLSTITTTPTLPTETPIPTPALGIGSTEISPKDGMTLLYVPAGEFTMGSDVNPDEQPIHKVTLDSYWIDQTDVTNAMYAKCVSAGKCSPPVDTSHYGNSNYANHPVVYVSWNGALAYCSWAGRRLPTEVEWEKAARGPNANIYPWGNESPNANLLNSNQNFGDTTEVGKYPNGKSYYGAYDMAGNVWQWISSLYQPYPYDATDGREILSLSGSRVLRGGSWVNGNLIFRSANRYWFDPASSNYVFGFRCARSEANATNQAPTVTVAPISTQAPALGIGSNMIGKDGMTLLYVPAGEFTMGSDVNSDEQPIRKVYLDAFWIDQTEVTNKQYKACVDAGTCEPPSSTSSQTHPNYYGNPEFNDYPFVWVSWDKANRYCEVWIGGDLPTEAQWEKAARGTDTRSYPWGNEAPNKDLLNYNGNIGDTTLIKNYPNTASFYGTYDMAGNVSEWVNDFYSETYYQSSASSNNPLGPESGQSRVLRGGSWDQVGTLVRSALRGKSVPMYAYVNIGFRCSRGTSP